MDRGKIRLIIPYKQANKNFRVFKKPDFSEKSGFSENFLEFYMKSEK